MYTLTSDNHISEWISTDGQKWKNGTLTSKSIKTTNNSNLATIFHTWAGCDSCRQSTLLVWQDTTASLKLGNLTREASSNADPEWHFAPMYANPTPGTGLALSLSFMSVTDNVPSNQWPAVSLLYQDKNLSICSADWNVDSGNHSDWHNSMRVPPCFTARS